jgi:two-component system, response regulator
MPLSQNKFDVEILLIEDDHDDADLVIKALFKNKISNPLLHITNGMEALDFLFNTGKFSRTKYKQSLKLILLDLNLPGMQGLQILKEIRSNIKTKNIPVIVISSAAPANDVIESYHLGITSFVVKPSTESEFTDEVSNLEVHKLLQIQTT